MEDRNERISPLAIPSLGFMLGGIIAFLIRCNSSKTIPSSFYIVMAVTLIGVLFHFWASYTTIEDLISAIILLFVFIISSYLIISSILLGQNQISDTELQEPTQIEMQTPSQSQTTDTSTLDEMTDEELIQYLYEKLQIEKTEAIETTEKANPQAIDISDLDAQIAELEAQKESLTVEQEKLDRIAELEAEISELKKESK